LASNFIFIWFRNWIHQRREHFLTRFTFIRVLARKEWQNTFLLNLQRVVKTKRKDYNWLITTNSVLHKIPRKWQIILMSLYFSTFVSMNSTIPRFMDQGIMKASSLLTIKSGILIQTFLSTNISKLSKPTKHLCKTLTIIQYLSLCLMRISNNFIGTTNDLYTGWHLYPTFSSLPQKIFPIYISAPLIKQILRA